VSPDRTMASLTAESVLPVVLERLG
jgi:hypothetical protein